MPLNRNIRSADTRTTSANSRGEIERILRKRGAKAFQFSQDIEGKKMSLAFVIASGANEYAVRIPVDLEVVHRKLYGPAEKITPKTLAQADRVAWRHLALLVDAAFIAEESGVQSASDALFAHVLVTADGQRASDVQRPLLKAGGAR